MPQQESTPSKKATSIGFVLGAACVMLAAALFFFVVSPRKAAPVAAGGETATTAAVPSPPAANAAPADMAANPHSFPPERSAAPGPPLLSGTISLDSSISQSPGSPVTVFVIARTGEGKGHPVLARRITVQSFPATFSLTSADSMMAGERPTHVSLEARIDLDGDAMTREPGSPAARVESDAIGSTKVGLTLKPDA